MDEFRSADALDRTAVLERVGGDMVFLREIVTLVAEDCPRLLVEIRTAISSRDTRALEHAAHTLKGSVANFGAEAARRAAFHLESLGRAGDLAQAPEACIALEHEVERFTSALSALARQLGNA